MLEIDIGAAGATYLSEQLRPERAICNAVAKVATGRGRLRAIVPAGTSVERARQLEIGGLMKMSASATWLTARLRGLPNGVVLWLDVRAKPSDRKPGGLLIGDCVAYAGLSASTDVREISRLPFSFSTVAIYLYFGATPLSVEAVLRDRSVDELADAVKEIYVSAYDQEGWVVWTTA